MSSSAYEPVGSGNNGAYRTALAPKHSTQGLVEEFELSSRDTGDDRPDKEDSIRETTHDKSEPRPIRRPLSRSVLLQATLDFLLVLPALYFLAFGFLVYSRDRSPLDGNDENSSLVAAANLGPTIFPIAFAAVVGRFLKSAAAWKLERQGATVGTLEQLLSSKTVVSAVTLPFSLRLFNVLTVPLIVLWALSPIGGQASRRVILTGPLVSDSYTNVSYLDSNSQFRMGGLWGGSTNVTEWPIYTAAYVGALVAPPAVKDSAQDVFAHFKIPMVEYLESSSPGRDDRAFIPVTDYSKVAWSALLGIPMSLVNGSSSNASLPSVANTTFNVESSYWNMDCAELALRDYYANPAAHTEGGSASFANFSKAPFEHVRTLDDGSGIHLGLQKHSRNSTGPRIIYWESLTGVGITHTKCKLTTTYVESQVTCQGTSCAVTAIRRSLEPFTPSTLSMLDYQIGVFEDWQFFVNWLLATPSTESSVWASPNQVYFTNPAAPFMVGGLSMGPPDIATNISTKTFNQRFSQLLNTAWLASVASSGLTTGHVPTSRMVPPWRPGPGTAYTIPSPGAYYMSKYTTATEQREQTVILCDRAWLAVLVVSSLAMLIAGIGGMVLEAGRRGPDILTAFSSLIRDNRFFRARTAGSMLDGFELAKVLAKEKVRLGDAARDEELGYVAIGMADGEDAMFRLQKGRMYA